MKKYDPIVYDSLTIKTIREQWLNCLLELSDIELQKERWLDERIRNPHWSYVEFTESYFSIIWNTGYEEMISCKYFTPEEYYIVKDFHAALESYQEPNGDCYDHEAILNDTKWRDIVASGKKTLAKLKKIITDDAELVIFDNYISPLTDGDFTWGLPKGENL